MCICDSVDVMLWHFQADIFSFRSNKMYAILQAQNIYYDYAYPLCNKNNLCVCICVPLHSFVLFVVAAASAATSSPYYYYQQRRYTFQ